MKKQFLLMISLAFGAMIVLNSCEPEVVTPPNLQVTPAETVMAIPGENVQYHVIISSDTDLSSLDVTVKMGETMIAMADTVFPESTQSVVLDFPFTVPADAEDGSTYVVTFEAKNTTESSVEIRNVDVNIPYGDINSYTAVILSDIENPNGSSFFSLDSNELMQLAAATAESEKIDIIYYYGVTNKATLCAPADTGVEAFEDRNDQPIVARFTTRNNTKLAAVEMTDADFNAIVHDGPITSNEPAETATAVTNLSVGDVLFAETVGGKKSLIMVKDITGTQGTSEITIEVKIQK